jgi:uncharacterized protein YcaQ
VATGAASDRRVRVKVVPAGQAVRIRNERRLRARHRPCPRRECPVEPAGVGEAGEPAVVEGVKAMWRVDPSQLGQPFSGRAALLPPLDRRIHDRKRTVELFGSTTSWRCISPLLSAGGGYFVLPVLYCDRLGYKSLPGQ